MWSELKLCEIYSKFVWVLKHTVFNEVWYTFKLCAWFQKLAVCDECENFVFLKTLARLSVLAPVFSSLQNWQFWNQSAKLLPKIETR